MLIVGLTSVSGPYIRARWSAFAGRCNTQKVYLIEFGKISQTYAWIPVNSNLPYNRITLSEQPAESQSTLKLIFLLLRELNRLKPDILILNGYREIVTLSALIWSILNCKPVILMSATKEDDAPRTWWVDKIKSFILKGYDAALVGGKPQNRYLEKLGMPSNSIFTGYNVVGNDDFHPNIIKTLPSPHQKPFFLAINRFVHKKNIPRLIAAYAEYRKSTSNEPWDLILCGDGELRCQVEQQITELGLEKYIYLPGFLQQTELLPYFAHASCFIHASTQEQWGLVVNEAMAAGVPVLVSNRCGCFEDLIIEGVNGFGFNPENIQQLTDLMVKVTSGNVDLEQIGQAALNHIHKFSPDYFARGLEQAVKYVLKN